MVPGADQARGCAEQTEQDEDASTALDDLIEIIFCGEQRTLVAAALEWPQEGGGRMCVQLGEILEVRPGICKVAGGEQGLVLRAFVLPRVPIANTEDDEE